MHDFPQEKRERWEQHFRDEPFQVVALSHQAHEALAEWDRRQGREMDTGFAHIEGDTVYTPLTEDVLDALARVPAHPTETLSDVIIRLTAIKQ